MNRDKVIGFVYGAGSVALLYCLLMTLLDISSRPL